MEGGEGRGFFLGKGSIGERGLTEIIKIYNFYETIKV